MNIKDRYLHGGSNIVKNISFSIPNSGTNSGKLVVTIDWATEGSTSSSTVIPISSSIFGSVNANTVLAGPNSSNGNPTFRSLVANDIPNISANKITSDTLSSDRLPWASNTAKGAILLGEAQDSTTNITGKLYWVKMNANGKLYVDIPWTDHTYTVNNATFSIKSKIGTNDAVTLSDFTANQSSADDFTLILGSNITFTNDATNRTLTIAGTPNTTYKLTLNGTTKGTTGGTDLGTFYAIATSNATAANQVWMRNSANDAYAWRTLGSNAFNSNSYSLSTHTHNADTITVGEGTSDVTDNTEILTSYASNNGFADTNAPNSIYRRDAIHVYNYIKSKLDSVYHPLNGNLAYTKLTGSSTTADQAIVSSGTANGWTLKTLGSNAFNSVSYLPLAGGTMTGAIKRYYSSASNDPMIALTSNNLDIWLWRINHSTSVSTATSGGYGFGLKYIGTGSGNDNTLILYADNQTGTQVAAMTMNQDGTIKLAVTPNVDGTNVSLVGHKHAYTDLTGSSTTANQAIVSNGTADGWTLKTLGSRAFDSTSYLPLTGGTLSGGLNFSATSHITWNNGTYLLRIFITDDSTSGTAVFTFLLSSDSGSNWTNLFTIKDDSTALLGTNTVYHSGNIPSNAKNTAGIVAGPGAAGKVYISNSSGAPTWDTYDTTVTLNSAHLITSGAVYTAIANSVSGAVLYQGTVASEAAMIALTSAGQGDFARVTTAFTFTDATGASVTAHVGDVVYLTNNTPGTSSNWIVAHTEIDTDTWTAASTSAAGYIPKLVTGGAALAASTTDYVLSYVNGATTPSWNKLPANAYKNDNTWRNVYTNGANGVGTGTGTKALNLKAGSNVTLTYQAAGTSSGLSGSADYFNVVIASKWQAANTSQEGYAPKLELSSTNTIATLSTEYVLTYISGSETAPVWRKLPSNAFANTVNTVGADDTNSKIFLVGVTEQSTNNGNKRGYTLDTAYVGTDGCLYSNSTKVSVEGHSHALGDLTDWASVTDVTVSSVVYHTFWKVSPTSSNLVYGWAVHPTNGLLYYIYNNKGTYSATAYSNNSNTWRNVYFAGTEQVGTGTGTKAVNYVAGSNVSITYEAAGTLSGQSGNANYFNVKIASTNTTYKLKLNNSTKGDSTNGIDLGTFYAPETAGTGFLKGTADGSGNITWSWDNSTYNNYSLSKATTSALGGIIISNALNTAVTLTSANGSTVSRYYGVQIDKDGKAFVNIPWTDTKVSFTSKSDNVDYYIPFKSGTTAQAEQLYFNSNIKVNPSNAQITATTFAGALSGNASTATNLNKASGTNRGYLYQSANTTTACTGVGSVTAATEIGIPYIGYASSANTYGIYKDLFYLSSSTKYLGNDIHSNKFATIKTKNSTTDDWTGSTTTGTSTSGGTTYTAGDGININNGTISTTRKEWYGTEAQFDALTSLDSNTTYYITAT